MSLNQDGPYSRFLIKLPWLTQGVYTALTPQSAFNRIRQSFEKSGFHIAASDKKGTRLCAYRDRKQRQCTCLHVVWVRNYGHSTYVSYGVEPRFFFFWLCSSENHFGKLRQCGQAIRAALEVSDS